MVLSILANILSFVLYSLFILLVSYTLLFGRRKEGMKRDMLITGLVIIVALKFLGVLR